ncbi:epidermal growth factor receptor substrate 15-like 1 isoform X1 [Drosophila bipectinata]|uniref:epidermal growth factor receptor substrate 15-like 1 isoform X1 n=2 Tax=Drosophila bipectinata TaxID=42026 RepID=UPI001C8A2C60|nr:epidermal growth factor receptor substrate 15-like 1 isoform X1 [Drosophila bipectinata]
MNLDFGKVCSKHISVYEAYYKQIDPKATGAIEAMTAAKFLKKSGLSDVVLSRIWDLSDPNGKGFLDKPGFFVALKLVSLSQAGQVANMNNIYVDTANPPKVGEIPKTMPSRIQTVPVPSGGITDRDWSIGVIDRLKYEQLFESLSPNNGMLPGNKVKGVLMDSKLPMNILGTIWDLADQDKDGNLDKHEFIVAMHLVYQTLQKRTVPSVLPPELQKPGAVGSQPAKPLHSAAIIPRAVSGDGFGDDGFVANFPKDIAPPAAIPPVPVAIPPMTRIPPVGAVSSMPLIQTDPLVPIGAPPSVTANADWVVTPAELKKFEEIFQQSDLDKDGLVSGLEVKDIFIKSGIPQRSLADIWALCDTNQSGKLTVEQFALAMWFVERKQRGVDPPHVLTANMVPPSMRSIVSGVDLQPQEVKPTYTNPELEMISNEIEELARERRVLETEIAQKEADVRVKNGEVRSLQSELDTLAATLKQLENQRGEAQKRLDDLQAQVTRNTAVLASVCLEISGINKQVTKIREQCQKQEETITEQEGELNTKRSELQKLKDEETSLQKEYDLNNRELSKLTKHLQSTQLQISSVRSMVTLLMETQRQMTDALLICRAAMDNQNAELVSEYQLKIEPDFEEARLLMAKEIEMPKDDPFDENNRMTAKQENNGFFSDPFSSQTTNKPAISTGFDDSFSANSGFDSGFDAFGQRASGTGLVQPQQRDPFGSDAFSTKNAITPEAGKDDFGSDPFAALHAPTGQGQVLSPNSGKSGPPPRPESPSPALPPKKSKLPPPRPAPPRATQPATGFGSSGGFADFEEFDNKLHKAATTHQQPAPLLDNFALLEDSGQAQANGASSPKREKSTGKSQPPEASLSSVISAAPTSVFETSLTLAADARVTPIQKGNFMNVDFSESFGAFETQKKSPLSHINGPTDFKDDPFKDYRYEDPFSIKDPFAEDDEQGVLQKDIGLGQKNNFGEDFSSDDDLGGVSKSYDTNLNNNNPTNLQVATPPNNDQNKQTGSFNLDLGALPLQNTISSNSEFNPIRKTAQSAVDEFADFDDFEALACTKNGASTKTTTTDKNMGLNDSFFDAFNENFGHSLSSTRVTNASEKKLEDPKAMDYNDCNENWFKDKLQTSNSIQLGNQNFAKFEEFEEHNFSSDFANTSLGSSVNENQNKRKETNSKGSAKEKFAADYSKPECFDADLEQALRRSMLEN